MEKEKLEEMQDQLVSSLLSVGDTFRRIAEKVSEVDVNEIYSTFEKCTEDMATEIDKFTDKIDEALTIFEKDINEEKEKEQKEETTTK